MKTQTGLSTVRPTRRLALLAVTFCALVITTLSAHDPFSLSAVVADSDLAASAYAISSDRSGAYVDYSEGRAPSVWSNRYGNIEIDLRDSTRAICLDFSRLAEPSLQSPGASYEPRSNCFPVLLRTLATSTTGGVTDLTSGDTGSFSMDIYFTAQDQNLLMRDYVAEFKRVEGSGILASASEDGNSWTLVPLYPETALASVSVMLSGKNGGWVRLGTYTLPFHIEAARTPNRRGGKK